uniref:Uncharacterized protein n=1 Tax=Oryzias latipes TaxID=8090 RepID=A0A3B3HMI9_ORYLA
MAQHVVLDKEKLICSICLDLQKDPVTIPCGHSYCLECIQNFWIGEEPKAPSCPQCRQSFTSRPVLVRNTILAELVEDARKAELQPTSSERSGTGPEHVDCDFCEGKKLKAAMSCLTCMVSYCEQHLQLHFRVAALKKHKLVKATLKLEGNICIRHEEVIKIFCRTDQKCICSLCSMDEHKGHDMVSAAAERAERQTKLGLDQQKNPLKKIFHLACRDLRPFCISELLQILVSVQTMKGCSAPSSQCCHHPFSATVTAGNSRLPTS